MRLCEGFPHLSQPWKQSTLSILECLGCLGASLVLRKSKAIRAKSLGRVSAVTTQL